MTFHQLFGGINAKKRPPLRNISSPLQFAAEIWALQVLINPYKPF